MPKLLTIFGIPKTIVGFKYFIIALFLMLVTPIGDKWNGKNTRLGFRPSIFVIDKTAFFTGYFASKITTIYLKKIPLNVSFQTVHPIHAVPETKFNWNLGLNFQF